MRGWKAGDEYPTYEDLETFLYFLNKYAFHNLGCHAFAKFTRNNPNKTLVDKLTSQDIAYAVLIYEDRMDVWEEGLRKDDDGFVRSAKQKYHVEEGTKLPKYGNGWKENGRAYFQELCGQFDNLIKNEKYFEALSEYWQDYLRKYHRSYYEKINKVSGIEEIEEEESEDEEGCLVELSDDEGRGNGLPPLPEPRRVAGKEASDDESDDSDEENEFVDEDSPMKPRAKHVRREQI